MKTNPYKVFLIKLVAFFALMFILDRSIGSILNYFYFEKKCDVSSTNYAIEKTKDEMLIFGSSRAYRHYIPEIFENDFNLSCFNTGLDGQSLFYNYAVLKGVLKRYSPEIIILDLNHMSFKFSQKHYDRLSALLPYYKNHPEIRSIIELKSRYEKIKLLSSIYPYNSLIIPIVQSNANKNTKIKYKGYKPIMATWDGSVKTDVYADGYSDKYEISKKTVGIYEAFIKDCINSKVKLYIVCSPRLVKSNKTDYTIALGKRIAKKNNIMFIDYSKESVFINNPKLFANPGHLNFKGAEIFSKMISADIKKAIEQNKK